ncbi:hypothetical protein [Cardinium endosymbiont of Nabis limbatus]|uniref:hypothetical protein n=1 Tax=Cardinium endosymbiont of Nabis limbatus TaxID=3066217 RepID=UPI003AF3945D
MIFRLNRTLKRKKEKIILSKKERTTPKDPMTKNAALANRGHKDDEKEKHSLSRSQRDGKDKRDIDHNDPNDPNHNHESSSDIKSIDGGTDVLHANNCDETETHYTPNPHEDVNLEVDDTEYDNTNDNNESETAPIPNSDLDNQPNQTEKIDLDTKQPQESEDKNKEEEDDEEEEKEENEGEAMGPSIPPSSDQVNSNGAVQLALDASAQSPTEGKKKRFKFTNLFKKKSSSGTENPKKKSDKKSST